MSLSQPRYRTVGVIIIRQSLNYILVEKWSEKSSLILQGLQMQEHVSCQ